MPRAAKSIERRSHNDRKANLLNQSSFRLGVPGSGKSFSVKEEIAFLILNTDDDILIADPEGEYAPLIEAMGNIGSVIRVAAGGKDRLNAMYMVDGYGENNPIVVKSQFIMSLVERIDPKGVGPPSTTPSSTAARGICTRTQNTVALLPPWRPSGRS